MNKKQTTILILALIIILGFLVYLGFNYKDKSPTPNVSDVPGDVNAPVDPDSDTPDDIDDPAFSEDPENIIEPNESVGDRAFASVNDLPERVFQTRGRVLDVSSDHLSIRSDGSHLNNGQESTINIAITEDTQILSRLGFSASISDIEEGDSVIVESSDNIKNVITEVEASTIRIR